MAQLNMMLPSHENNMVSNAAKPAPVPTSVPNIPKPFTGTSGLLGSGHKIASEGAISGMPNMSNMPVMHQGGIVQKDGPVMLEQGEKVIPAEKKPEAKPAAKPVAKMGEKNNIMTKDEGHKKEMKAKSAKKHNGFKKTTIHHHTDGTHSFEHEHENHPKHSVSGSAADLQGVHDSLEANIGQGTQPGDVAQAQPMAAEPTATPAMAAPAPAMPAAAPAPAMA